MHKEQVKKLLIREHKKNHKKRNEVKPHTILIPEILRNVLKSLLLAQLKSIFKFAAELNWVRILFMTLE